MTKINPNQGILFPKWIEEDLLNNQGERIPHEKVMGTILSLEVLAASEVASTLFQQPSLRKDVLPDFDFTTWRSLRDPTPSQDAGALLEDFAEKLPDTINGDRVKQMLYELNPASIKPAIVQGQQGTPATPLPVALRVLNSFKRSLAERPPIVVCVDRMPELPIVGKSKVSSRPEFVFDSKQIARLCSEAEGIEMKSEINKTNSQYLAIMAGIALHEHNIPPAKSRLYLKKAYDVDRDFLHQRHERFIARAYRVFYASLYVDEILQLNQAQEELGKGVDKSKIAGSINVKLDTSAYIRSQEIDFILENADEILSYRK